jgi:hypothetical protein
MRRNVIGLILASLIPLLAVAAGGCQATPGQRLIRANDSVTALYQGVATARDAGLIKQADIDKYAAVRKAIDDALDGAGRAYRAGNIPAMDSAIAIVAKSLQDLQPLLKQQQKAGP